LNLAILEFYDYAIVEFIVESTNVHEIGRLTEFANAFSSVLTSESLVSDRDWTVLVM